jgi:Fe-S-cluster-containing dehydrogenase component
MKAILIDITRCNGCFNCQIACKDEHVDNDWSPYAKPQPDMGHFWMRVNEVERGVVPKVKVSYVPKLCMQCENPPCEKVARDGAVYRRKDGIVIIDPEKSKGQRKILESCPYGCIFWNEGLDIPQKCTSCAHLLDQGWKEPRCVEACCTGAMIFGEYDQLKDIINKRKGEILNPEFGSKPRVYYIGLPKRFVAGTVLCQKIGEPLENAKVTLSNLSTRESITTKVDNYGDFEYEGLEIGAKFSVLIEKAGYQTKLMEPVHTEKDVYLGEIFLLPKE